MVSPYYTLTNLVATNVQGFNSVVLNPQIATNTANIASLSSYVYSSVVPHSRIPLIVLNGVSATASVGLSGYGIDQNIISGLVCVIGLTNSVVGSIELFIGIEKQSESALLLSKEFYVLAIDIYKTIHLNAHERGVEASTFLNETYSRYIELIRQNGVMDKNINDQLLDLDGFNSTIKMREILSPKSLSSTSFDSEVELV
jgi:hypothetical protein